VSDTLENVLNGNAELGPTVYFFLIFSARQHRPLYAIARYMSSPVRLSVRLSVCLSVRHMGGSVKDG